MILLFKVYFIILATILKVIRFLWQSKMAAIFLLHHPQISYQLSIKR